MHGQVRVFQRNAPEKIPCALERYMNETLRLYGVLDTRLQAAECLAEESSIADIATWPWVSLATWTGIALSEFPNLSWRYDVIAARPAVERGRAVPEPIDLDAVMKDQAKVDEIEARGRRRMQK